MKISKFLAFSLVFCSTLAYAEDPLPKHICASHAEGSGLGYKIGYSSLELFLSQPLLNQTLVPFIDLRGHIFNDGKYAANAGAGLRYLSDCCSPVWGVNAFYDYLQTHRRIYNQVGIGLEALGECWEARLNGYLPVGDKKLNIYRFSYDFNRGSRQDQRRLPNFLLKAREQLAMKGVDLLICYRYSKNRCFDLTIGAGPYIYWGKTAKTVNAFFSKQEHAYGGQVRACASFMKYVLLEGIGTYDSLFKWNGQVTLTLCLPFDFSFNQNECFSCYFGESSYCSIGRLYKPVKRNEIIVVDSLNRFSTDPQVLDPENEPL